VITLHWDGADFIIQDLLQMPIVKHREGNNTEPEPETEEISNDQSQRLGWSTVTHSDTDATTTVDQFNEYVQSSRYLQLLYRRLGHSEGDGDGDGDGDAVKVNGQQEQEQEPVPVQGQGQVQVQMQMHQEQQRTHYADAAYQVCGYQGDYNRVLASSDYTVEYDRIVREYITTDSSNMEQKRSTVASARYTPASPLPEFKCQQIVNLPTVRTPREMHTTTTETVSELEHPKERAWVRRMQKAARRREKMERKEQKRQQKRQKKLKKKQRILAQKQKLAEYYKRRGHRATRVR